MTGKKESRGAEDAAPTLPSVRPPCERLPCNKSSVCSRSYFVVVMVFFHIYIINVIALLLYVHYSNGQDEASGQGRDAPSSDHQRPASGSQSPKPDVSLARIEGIRVSSIVGRLIDAFHPDTSVLWPIVTVTVGGTCPEGVTGARKSA